MILVIDNFDSFTFNIVQYLREFGCEVVVKRNNKISTAEIRQLAPSHIVISPGPGAPQSSGVSLDVVRELQNLCPILGLCLGHQCIGEAFGGKIVRAKQIYHGKISSIEHDGKGVFAGLASPIKQTRYHSLVIDKKTVPSELSVTAWSEDGEIMGVRHKSLPIEGVQFHPESIGSQSGAQILKNFVTPHTVQMPVENHLKKVLQGQSLEMAEAEQVMNEMAVSTLSTAQMASFLTALTLKGETVDEIAGFAKVVRERAEKLKTPASKVVVDNCGTGGDASGTFNISTVAALVAAGAGVCVAKHGNRSITSKCGSADLLEALGVNLSLPKACVEKSLKTANLAFLFAPQYHQTLRNVADVRRALGIRTIFNIIGPLVNPARVAHQIIGVFAPHLTAKVAEVMRILGTKHGLVVCGDDGLDEITITTTTQVAELKNGEIKTYVFEPEQVGFKRAKPDDLRGGTVAENKAICLEILAGATGPKTDIVLLNAAATIYVAGLADSLQAGVGLAQESIKSGAAQAKLEQLVKLTN